MKPTEEGGPHQRVRIDDIAEPSEGFITFRRFFYFEYRDFGNLAEGKETFGRCEIILKRNVRNTFEMYL
jgi:hypothetical protein